MSFEAQKEFCIVILLGAASLIIGYVIAGGGI